MVPVLSGTSLAGGIRSQALRIAHTLSNNEQSATKFVRNLFGYMPADKKDKVPKATSRVLVKETEITGDYKRLVQSRVAIDRFTGGALESALFTERPIFGGETELTISIKKPTATTNKKADIKKVEKRWQAEKGLLLLVLKDLWTGFLPIGGEASVGRGRLKGLTGQIVDENGRWQLGIAGEPFVSGDDPADLQEYVDALNEIMAGGDAS